VLSAVGVFSTLARFAWSRVLRMRPPVQRHVEQNLRDARRSFDLASAMSQAWIFVPLSISGLTLLYDAAEGGQWVGFSAGLAVTLVYLAAVVGILGAAMLLLLMLPALSVLLWPFGIFPTTAAALLAVSVEEAPTPRWNVVHVAENGVSTPRIWLHSTYSDQTSIDVVCSYLRQVIAANATV
jgi:hypothetical protein